MTSTLFNSCSADFVLSVRGLSVTWSRRSEGMARKRLVSRSATEDSGVKWWHGDEQIFNTLKPRQNERHFPDDVFKCIFLNENVWISIKISLKFVPIPALVQIRAWRRPGDKQLSEPMMLSLLTHIYVTWPEWVKPLLKSISSSIRHNRQNNTAVRTACYAELLLFLIF